MSVSYSDWVGRSESAVDVLEPARTVALTAALGGSRVPTSGASLPLLHHWLYFWNVPRPQGMGADGHPARGGFLPPVPLPRRMWAGGRLDFLKPLIVGECVRRDSVILRVEAKSGRNGALLFVTVQHNLSGAQGLAVVEEQDIVFRDIPSTPSHVPSQSDSSPPEAEWRETVQLSPVTLFRYSALTMNAHRIHYDRPYAVQQEAYPALVVHGPLQATMLIDLADRNLEAPITRFEFRGQAPAFDGSSLHVCGNRTEKGAQLWTQQGAIPNMTAIASCTLDVGHKSGAP